MIRNFFKKSSQEMWKRYLKQFNLFMKKFSAKQGQKKFPHSDKHRPQRPIANIIILHDGELTNAFPLRVQDKNILSAHFHAIFYRSVKYDFLKKNKKEKEEKM